MATFRVVRVDLLATRLFKLRSRGGINLREKARNIYAKTSRQIEKNHEKHAKTKRTLHRIRTEELEAPHLNLEASDCTRPCNP